METFQFIVSIGIIWVLFAFAAILFNINAHGIKEDDEL